VTKTGAREEKNKKTNGARMPSGKLHCKRRRSRKREYSYSAHPKGRGEATIIGREKWRRQQKETEKKLDWRTVLVTPFRLEAEESYILRGHRGVRRNNGGGGCDRRDKKNRKT